MQQKDGLLEQLPGSSELMSAKSRHLGWPRRLWQRVVTGAKRTEGCKVQMPPHGKVGCVTARKENVSTGILWVSLESRRCW